jgi:hypothetical protein
LILEARKLDNNQSSLMVHKFHMPTRQYFIITLDAKLRWEEHIKTRNGFNVMFRKMYWYLGRNSELSIHNELILYKQFIHPVCSYGIQLLGCASNSNIQVIQRYENKLLKFIVNPPWHVRNSDLHRDLGIETVTDIIAKFAKSHEKRLQSYINIEASKFLNVNNMARRLKRKKPFELVRR